MSGRAFLRGASSALRALSSAATSAVAVLALSLAIVWPLWKLATTNRLAFTIAVGAAACLTLLVAVARAALRRRSAMARRTRHG